MESTSKGIFYYLTSRPAVSFYFWTEQLYSAAGIWSLVMNDQLQNQYWLDKHDRIIRVSEHWDTFLTANDGPDNIAARSIIGRSIWDFVAGDVAKMWLRSIVSYARLTSDKEVIQQYRCDSQELRRYMEMRLVRGPEGELQISHYLKKQEPREEQPISINRKRASSLKSLLRCSVCERINLGDDWTESNAFPISDSGPTVIHTVCPYCVKTLPGVVR